MSETTVEPQPTLTLSIEEAARRLGISRGLGYALAREGKLPGMRRLGAKRVIVSVAALDAYLSGN